VALLQSADVLHADNKLLFLDKNKRTRFILLYCIFIAGISLVGHNKQAL
jgi:hypothetical protein